jgi:hypothetical protein
VSETFLKIIHDHHIYALAVCTCGRGHADAGGYMCVCEGGHTCVCMCVAAP